MKVIQFQNTLLTNGNENSKHWHDVDSLRLESETSAQGIGIDWM